MLRCFRVTDRAPSVCSPAGWLSPLELRVSSPASFRTKSLRSPAVFLSLSMVFVCVLSAMPKVPLLRAIPFLLSGLAACRVPSSLLPPGVVRLPSGLSDAPGEDATRCEVAVPLLIVLLPTPILPRRSEMPLFFDLSPIVVAVRPEEMRAGAMVLPAGRTDDWVRAADG